MTETAFRSTHPAVLAMAAFCEQEWNDWTVRLVNESWRLQRHVVQRTVGLCQRQQIVGLVDEGADLPGWVVGERGFLIPAAGAEGKAARQWLADHQPPPPVEQRLAPFGLEAERVTVDEIFWPGVELLDDGLYVTWGCDTGWDGSGFFEPVKLSEYHAARERR